MLRDCNGVIASAAKQSIVNLLILLTALHAGCAASRFNRIPYDYYPEFSKPRYAATPPPASKLAGLSHWARLRCDFAGLLIFYTIEGVFGEKDRMREGDIGSCDSRL